MHRVPEAFWDEFRKVSYRVHCSRLQRGGSSEILVELCHRIQKSDHQPAHFVTYIYVLHRKKSRRAFNKMLIILISERCFSPRKNAERHIEENNRYKSSRNQNILSQVPLPLNGS